MQTLLRRNILRSAFLDYKLVEYINILKGRVCQSEKDESGYGSTEKSHFANLSSIYLSRVQSREFGSVASRLVAIQTPKTRTSSSCFEPSRSIACLKTTTNQDHKKISFEKNMIFDVSMRV